MVGKLLKGKKYSLLLSFLKARELLGFELTVTISAIISSVEHCKYFQRLRRII